MTSTSPIRIGLLGCGRIGRMHAELVARRVEGLSLGAVYDVATAAAVTVAAEHGGFVAGDPHELINSDQVDAVAI